MPADAFEMSIRAGMDPACRRLRSAPRKLKGPVPLAVAPTMRFAARMLGVKPPELMLDEPPKSDSSRTSPNSSRVAFTISWLDPARRRSVLRLVKSVNEAVSNPLGISASKRSARGRRRSSWPDRPSRC